MNATAAKVIATSTALYPEELFIADYEGFGAVATRLGEYASFEAVARVGQLIDRCGSAFLAWIEATEPDLDSIDQESFEQAYCGEWESERDFAEDFVTECGWAGVPAAPVAIGSVITTIEVNPIEALASYLDWRQITAELLQQVSTQPSRARRAACTCSAPSS